jgi:hypothetical protein
MRRDKMSRNWASIGDKAAGAMVIVQLSGCGIKRSGEYG